MSSRSTVCNGALIEVHMRTDGVPPFARNVATSHSVCTHPHVSKDTAASTRRARKRQLRTQNIQTQTTRAQVAGHTHTCSSSSRGVRCIHQLGATPATIHPRLPLTCPDSNTVWSDLLVRSKRLNMSLPVTSRAIRITIRACRCDSTSHNRMYHEQPSPRNLHCHSTLRSRARRTLASCSH